MAKKRIKIRNKKKSKKDNNKKQIIESPNDLSEYE